uniref:Uncharacterized protein n=1 Tax=Noctiluca scintillans TaxID=2966 RepID=A0A7S1FKG9_NOCSC
MELQDEQSVSELRHVLSCTLGLVQHRRGLSYHGKVMTSNRVIADILGLNVDVVVVPPPHLKSAKILDVWGFGVAQCIGKIERSPTEQLDLCEEVEPNWEVKAVAYIKMSYGQGFILLGQES